MKKFLRIINESLDVDIDKILSSLSESIKKSGIEVKYEDINFDNEKIYVDIASKDTNFKYEVSLLIDYNITKEGSYNYGNYGNYEAPSTQNPEWEMSLDGGIVYYDGVEVYQGKNIIEKFFSENYQLIYSHFNNKIKDNDLYYVNESKKSFVEFVKKELNMLKEEYNNPIVKGSETIGFLKSASGNPLNGKTRQTAINYIYKIFKQIDHGQRYKDEAWENVHKIFKLFKEYGMDTVGGYNSSYNPGGIFAGEDKPQWKKWYYDFNYINNNGIEKTLTFVLTAHAAGSVTEPWDSYDITFYPIN